MKECPHCGVSVGNSDRTCPHCNADLDKRENATGAVLEDLLAFPEEIRGIIAGYINLLDEMGRDQDPRLLRPLSRLPYPREEIQGALKTALGIAKDETLRNQLETALIFLEDFIPDHEVPQDPDENLNSWLGRKDWKNPKTRDLLAVILTKIFIEEYGDRAQQKVEEFLEERKGRYEVKQ